METASLQNPVLHYRLDPGEPGIRTSAPASQSALLVHAQEQRNETRLVRNAINRGEVVVDSSKTFTPGVDGSYLSVRARSLERELDLVRQGEGATASGEEARLETRGRALEEQLSALRAERLRQDAGAASAGERIDLLI